jgi:N4-gp56 family major capsid protein
MATQVGYGDAKKMVEQAAGLFATHMNRNGNLAKMRGKMPKGEAGVSETLRKQTTTDMPIVQTMDLGKGKGDEVKFNLVQPVGAYPIMGDNKAEGRGTAIAIEEASLRVNQARFPVDLGSKMTQIRSPVDFRNIGRPIAQSLMDAYIDQACLVHMAGARGFHNNIEWRVPLAAHTDFAEIMINTVKAPTKNRHFVCDGTAVTGVIDNAGDLTITTADTLDMDIVDAMRSVLDQMPLPPPMVKLEGDAMAEDDPLRLMLLSPAAYNTFASDSAFRSFQAAAMARASSVVTGQKKHPLFTQQAGIWNNFLMLKMARPIRFYAGQAIKYCASATSETESEVLVPAAFSTTHAVDRSLILGGQGVAEALAKHDKSGMPFFWSEVELDHGNSVELLVGAIRAASKIRFNVNTGNGMEYTDHGIIAIDSAVPITGAGN